MSRSRPLVLLLSVCARATFASISASAPSAPSLRRDLSAFEPMSENSHAEGRNVLGRLSDIKCIFSDLDGTLCHFDRHTKHYGVEITEDEASACANVRNSQGEERHCRLLPTSTMGAGVISDKTVALVDELRSLGVKFVIISGARTTTMFARYPRLPTCDAIACETGAKILYPPSFVGSETCLEGSGIADQGQGGQGEVQTMKDPFAHRIPTGGVLNLDSEWSKPFENVTGPLDSSLAPLERNGTLWDMYRELSDLDLEPDARGYYGCFRVNCRNDESKLARLRPFLDEGALAARGIGHAMNLGMYDFFPSLAGKGPVVRFLQAKWGLKQSECIALFDDDNDIKMVHECGAGLLPGVTSDSVKKRLPDEPGWGLAKSAGTGVFATEELLESIVREVKERRRSERVLQPASLP